MTGEAYRAWEQDYAKRGRLWGGTRLDAHTSSVLDEETRLSTGRWLDAGTGDGKGLVPLLLRLRAGANVIALDASRSALGHAKKGVADKNPGLAGPVGFVQADVTHLPLREAWFDAVRAVHIVGHLREELRVQALRALLGCLVPGGRLILSEFGTRDFRCGKGEEVEPGTFRRGTGIETHYFTRDELTGLVDLAGGSLLRLREERYEVHYGGQALPRQRWDLLATIT